MSDIIYLPILSRALPLTFNKTFSNDNEFVRRNEILEKMEANVNIVTKFLL